MNDEIVDVLASSMLFEGVDREDIVAMLDCLGAVSRTFEKGQVVFARGERMGAVAVLTAGRVAIQDDDWWGRRTIVDVIAPGGVFLESYAMPGSPTLMNDVVALEDGAVVLLDAAKVMTTCSSACAMHTRVFMNLLSSLAGRNRALVRRLSTLSRRTTREKILSYLSQEAARQGSSSFTIPLDRQALADYLAVDRSAMSSELSRMRKDALVDFHTSSFTLLSPSESGT